MLSSQLLKNILLYGRRFAYSWALCSEEEKTPVMCKMIEVIEVQCVVLRADAVFLEPSKLLLEFTVFSCCNLGGSQWVR